MPGAKEHSPRTVYPARTLLRLLLLLLAGTRLIDRNIHEMGGELLHSKLLALLEPVDSRYETLYRIGLEDSLVHQREIKDLALAEFKAYRYRDSGSVFVVNRSG